ncbi:MAG TPA: tetratricopeptide repeat protein [Archangium sp.]
MIRLRLALGLGLVLAGCAGTPPPTQRALECNELCAQYIAMGNLQAAEDQCDLGLQFSPQYADLWVNKGVISFNRGQDDKAKEYFIKALRLNQDQAQAYNNLGQLYMKELQYGKGHDNFQRALRVNPDYLEARYNLALAYKALNQLDKAKKELRTLLHVRPDLADAWGQLGQIAIEEGENEKAIEYLTKTTQIDSKFTAAWMVLGNAYMEAGKPCDAKDAFSTCLENDENFAQCRNNIIVAERKCKLQDKALDDVKQRAAGAKTPEGEYSLALQAKEKGLVNDEERAYKRCLKYDGKYALCHFGLFELFKNRSDEKNASVACKNFLKFANEADFQTQVATCKQYVSD